MTGPIILAPESVELIAQRVADLLHDEPTPPARLLTAGEAAQRLGTSVDFVYRNQADLGARKLGEGPRARLRFDPEVLDSYLTRNIDALTPELPRLRPRRRSPVVDLLPIERDAA